MTHDLEDLRRRAPIEAFAASRIAGLRRRGARLVALCPFHVEKTPSFTVEPAKGRFICYGCHAKGDVFELVQRLDGCDFREAVETVAAFSGSSPGTGAGIGPGSQPGAPARAKDDARPRGVKRAREIWRSARPAEGTPVEAYLRGRGITIAPPPSIRFLPECPYWHAAGPEKPREVGRFPAMVAAFQLRGRVVGVHLTWLDPSGAGKAPLDKLGIAGPAKKMRGATWGAAIRLAPPPDPGSPDQVRGRSGTGGGPLGLAEGIETGLSVRQACPALAVWVAGSLGNLAGPGRGPATVHPEIEGKWVPTRVPDLARPGLVIPSFVRETLLLGDGDGDPHVGAALIARAHARQVAEGRRCRVARPGDGVDFNDLLKGAA